MVLYLQLQHWFPVFIGLDQENRFSIPCPQNLLIHTHTQDTFFSFLIDVTEYVTFPESVCQIIILQKAFSFTNIGKAKRTFVETDLFLVVTIIVYR